VYDSCLTPRVYRPALSHEEARKIIVNGKGTEFDPVIVETFEAAYNEFLSLDIDIESQILQKKSEGSLYGETDTGR
jgi:putative two-component system response regulator